MIGRLHNNIGTQSVRQLPDSFHHILPAAVDDMIRPELLCNLKPLRVLIKANDDGD